MLMQDVLAFMKAILMLELSPGCTLLHGNRKIHEDLGVPFFADHIVALTESFDSKLADVGKP